MPDFKSKYGPWAIVAGASEGLGAAFAEELANRGLNLILIARRSEKLEVLSKDLKEKYPIDIKCHMADLADLVQTKHLVSQLEKNIGLLVYNAAYAPIGHFETIAEEDLIKIVDVNVRSPLMMTKLLLPQMIEKRKGGIVLMSSLAGAQGSPNIATYAASKAFNTILAEGLWSELKKHNIDVTASCAGAISTPGYKNAQSAKDAPGTLSAAKVALETLNALGKGPTTVPGFTNKIARFFMGRLFSRKFAISIMKKNTKQLS
ncbi:MAG: SDR family NAD(P)-dependent oxidoreductase [Bacteroidia bacterium]